ncbi:hypothetical protein PMAYCL1PPCAC_24106, partial [Pristionchus mayeri]
ILLRILLFIFFILTHFLLLLQCRSTVFSDCRTPLTSLFRFTVTADSFIVFLSDFRDKEVFSLVILFFDIGLFRFRLLLSSDFAFVFVEFRFTETRDSLFPFEGAIL